VSPRSEPLAPPLGFLSLRRHQLGRSFVTVCLTVTLRSQRFSRSQRFDPARTSQLCFMLQPPMGFPASSAFPACPAVAPFSARCPRAVAPATNVALTRLRGFAPDRRPFPTAKLLHPPPGRYAPDLSPLRGMQAADSGRSPSPPALTSSLATNPKANRKLVSGATGDRLSRVVRDNRRPTRKSTQPP